MEGNRDEIIRWMTSQPPEKIFKVTECNKKRSLNANSYFYVLVNKIARVQKISDSEVHDKILSENLCFITKDGALEWKVCSTKPVRYRLLYDPKMEEREYWFDSLMRVDLTRKDGTPCVNRDGEKAQGIVYWRIKGSHQMDTKEMSRLIESTIFEAKQIGIETMPPAELEKLLNSWKGET